MKIPAIPLSFTIILALFTLFAVPAMSLTFSLTPPQLDLKVNPALQTLNPILYGQISTEIENIETDFNTEIATAFADIETEARNQLEKYGSLPKLGEGFANANIYSARSATLQGYQNYNGIAVAVGFMVGGQLPSMDLSQLEAIGTTIAEEGDAYLGLSIGASYFNVGLPTKNLPFLKNIFGDRWYANVQFGTIGLEFDFGDFKFDFNTTTIGLGLSFQLVKPVPSVIGGLFGWNGVSVSSGIIFRYFRIRLVPSADAIKEAIDYDPSQVSGSEDSIIGEVAFDPSAELSINMTSWTIPIDITTSFRLLWIMNVTLGVGADFSLGVSDIILAAGGTGGFTSDPTSNTDQVYTITTTQDLDANLDGSTKGSTPGFVAPRLLAGVGLSLGPVKIDVPVAYYFNVGISAGVTIAVVL